MKGAATRREKVSQLGMVWMFSRLVRVLPEVEGRAALRAAVVLARRDDGGFELLNKGVD